MKIRWVLIPHQMLLAMFERGYSYRVIDGDLPGDVRVREAYVVGESISLLVESESFTEVPDGNVPEIVPSIEFMRDTRGRCGVLPH